MNCECFYVVKENTLEAARELAKRIDDCAIKQMEEVYPVYICKTKKDFGAATNYDGWKSPYKVKAGTYLVFAQGKDYCMDRIRPKGGKRGFPNETYQIEFWTNFKDFIEDIEPCKSWIDDLV